MGPFVIFRTLARRLASPLSLARLAVVGMAALTGCTVNEATGRRQFNLMSTEEEIALGAEAMPELVKEYGGEVQDATLRDYVTKVGRELSRHTEGDASSLPWEFTLLDSDVINAFALPGGKVFMSRGLMEKMDNEAQLAGVLGHEIGHVTAQHVDERISQAYAVQFGASLAGAFTRGSNYGQLVNLVVGVGGQGYLLKFSRDQESEADYLGMRYMARAGYDPKGQLQVMKILAAEERQGTPPEFLSTHPYPETRIERINELLRTDFRKTQNNPEYQLHEERFERVAAPRLAAIEPRRGRPLLAAAALEDPSMWCAHCRGESSTPR